MSKRWCVTGEPMWVHVQGEHGYWEWTVNCLFWSNSKLRVREQWLGSTKASRELLYKGQKQPSVQPRDLERNSETAHFSSCLGKHHFFLAQGQLLPWKILGPRHELDNRCSCDFCTPKDLDPLLWKTVGRFVPRGCLWGQRYFLYQALSGWLWSCIFPVSSYHHLWMWQLGGRGIKDHHLQIPLSAVHCSLLFVRNDSCILFYLWLMTFYFQLFL